MVGGNHWSRTYKTASLEVTGGSCGLRSSEAASVLEVVIRIGPNMKPVRRGRGKMRLECNGIVKRSLDALDSY